MSISKNEHIAIIGSGAFGLSTAFELSQQGYTNITVFEKDFDIPSRWSAANDLNKIMRVEYEDLWYTELGVEAAKKWQSPPYAPYFHRVGYLNCVSGAGTQKAFNSMESFKAAGEAHPEVKPWISTVSTRQELQDICWQFNQGEMPGWKGYFNRYDGYVHSANALRGIYRSARSIGVRFCLGERKGAIQEIVYEGIGSSRKSVGVKTRDGQFHAASLIIVATGAGASKIIPEVGARVSAKSWSVAHVRLTDDETATLRGIPVTYARDLGFFFEPDPKTNLLKLCPMGGGFINTNPETGVSEAPESVQRFVPPEDERKMRELLRQTLPYLADRPLVEKTLCWFADTSNSDFIIDYLPETSNTVIVLSGDSGHGFKMFPIFGSWVNNLLNAPEGRQIEKRWQWRTNKQNDGSASQDDVSWRVGDVQELRDITPSAAKL